MKKITRWSPDTCGCVIDYEWDTDDPPETRKHTAVAAVGCKHHQGHHTDVHAAVLRENQKKNQALNLVAETLGLSPEEIRFSHDDKRTLQLTADLSDAQKAEAEKYLADNGHGDVVIHV